MSLMLNKFLVNLRHLVECALCDHIRFVYLIANSGLQILDTHQVIRLFAPLMESKGYLVEVAHHVQPILVFRLRTGRRGQLRDGDSTMYRTCRGQLFLKW